MTTPFEIADAQRDDGSLPADLISSYERGVAELRAARDHAVQTGAVRLALSTAVTNTTAQALYDRDGWRRDTAFLHYELPKDGR